MGRLFACVLLVAACGDNVVVDPSPAETLATHGVNGGSVTVARYVPSVCAVNNWSVPFATPSVDVAITSEHGVTSLLTAPAAGGQLAGFAVDERMSVITDPNATALPVTGAFTAVAASIVNHRVVATGMSGDSARVELFGDVLSDPVDLAKIPATSIAKPPFAQVNDVSVLATGGVNGLTFTQVSPNFQLGESLVVGKSAQVTSLSMVQYGLSTLATWSTVNDECYVERIASFVPSQSSHTNVKCDGARIAADTTNDEARIVFEGGGGLRLIHISHMQIGGDSVPLRPAAHAPRVAFDGTRYWVSYIDVRGDIVVGFLDQHSQLISTALIGPAPVGESYELSVIDGRVWVFSLDALNGYMGHQLCVVADN